MKNELYLKQIISGALRIDSEKINVDTTQNTLAEWDSLGHVAILSCLEKEINASFSAREASRMLSVKEIIQILENYGFNLIDLDSLILLRE